MEDRAIRTDSDEEGGGRFSGTAAANLSNGCYVGRCSFPKAHRGFTDFGEEDAHAKLTSQLFPGPGNTSENPVITLE